jgi:hypothetical protein
MIKKNIFTEHTFTIIPKGIIYLMGIAIVGICGILLPELAREEAVGKAHPPAAYPFLIGAWIISLPIFFALYQTLKLLNSIDKNTAFSKVSIKALQNIKICAAIFSAFIIVGAVTVIITARLADPREDVTPIIMLGFICTFTTSIIATFVAVLQKLLEDAITIKKENDLTV